MDNSLFRSSGTRLESTQLNQYCSKLSHVLLLTWEAVDSVQIQGVKTLLGVSYRWCFKLKTPPLPPQRSNYNSKSPLTQRPHWHTQIHIHNTDCCQPAHCVWADREILITTAGARFWPVAMVIGHISPHSRMAVCLRCATRAFIRPRPLDEKEGSTNQRITPNSLWRYNFTTVEKEAFKQKLALLFRMRSCLCSWSADKIARSNPDKAVHHLIVVRIWRLICITGGNDALRSTQHLELFSISNIQMRATALAWFPLSF